MSTYSDREQDFIRSEVSMLRELNIITPSASPWVSALVCVRKPDGSLRLCIDFRPLNACTVSDPYPIPVISSLLRKMARAQYFSTMDIASAFWHIPMHKDDVQYTGFITPSGKYEWLRMPFGLKNASSTF
jgi:Reverse transcriptase (RNA-dependent DNA polymerase)